MPTYGMLPVLLSTNSIKSWYQTSSLRTFFKSRNGHLPIPVDVVLQAFRPIRLRHMREQSHAIDDPATVWDLELQAIYEPVVTTGVENDHLVGVAGDRLFFTLVCSEKVMSRFEWKMLHEEAIIYWRAIETNKSIYLWRKHDEINFQSHNFTSQSAD